MVHQLLLLGGGYSEGDIANLNIYLACAHIFATRLTHFFGCLVYLFIEVSKKV